MNEAQRKAMNKNNERGMRDYKVVMLKKRNERKEKGAKKKNRETRSNEAHEGRDWQEERHESSDDEK